MAYLVFIFAGGPSLLLDIEPKIINISITPPNFFPFHGAALPAALFLCRLRFVSKLPILKMSSVSANTLFSL
jgi:hypothetical protein